MVDWVAAIEWYASYFPRAKLIPDFWNEYPKAKGGFASDVVKSIFKLLDVKDRKTLRTWTRWVAIEARLDNRGLVAFQAGFLAAGGISEAAGVDPTSDEEWKVAFMETL